ncbi:MAG: hypothetical protein FWH15_05360 [Betaproteobacteria bacterium]|nr:hypothetical protein [Betaproteobacteria bacterium]
MENCNYTVSIAVRPSAWHGHAFLILTDPNGGVEKIGFYPRSCDEYMLRAEAITLGWISAAWSYTSSWEAANEIWLQESA